MTCQCEQCTKEPAPTWTKEYRHKTEVNHVSEQDGEWIKEYLDGIKEKRGYAAYKKLRDNVEIEYRRIRKTNVDN